ncbi:hypothetical protein A3A76_00095 [Candidatus Woesebacteria bacterium RIFCSPLOWO2_01_FULL_39_23]|uniref:histidine kinase n=1 Tax=Candidatus Woesebacteria bacterium RIFCSPHIGHO2_01_FULL_40_22 TaxID=1802499 RepID=A0A1F7YG57_9BACT|nr:MAG: hypothetical protein A2141_03055 [Candidatus Woesebacteria bacterium RBG_16_40_11]OGM26283.1 MAG: hypothetical protein A2628_03715 [Candidatus Woesebacteria bacterium RIFCSPHIGHO2_01_FULL_40_22]OGM62838.1 MAG: hypothetical protein A3A76_00095 [Candidatus Woesebacteria bacterium RIFCSPLOWO2_01_FULL_39_23]
MVKNTTNFISQFKSSLDVIVLILLLGITFGFWKTVDSLVERQNRTEMLGEVSRIEQAAKSNMDRYVGALYSVKGLFSASVDVERSEFDDYFTALDISSQYPGIYSFGYTSRVAHKDASHFLENLKQELNKEGLPITSIPEHVADVPEHYFLNYIVRQPELGTPVSYGLDQSLDETRRVAMEHARDTGEAVASGPVILAGPEMSGFLVTLAIYKNGASANTQQERRQALVGFVNSAYGYQELMSDLFSEAIAKKIEVHVNDGGKIVFDTLKEEEHEEHDVFSLAKRTLDIAGRQWEVEFFTPTPTLRTGAVEYLPAIVLISGCLLSFALFGLTRTIVRGGMRADALVQEVTAQLKEDKNTLSLIVGSMGEGVLMIDRDHKIDLINAKAVSLFGVDEKEVIGHKWTEFVKAYVGGREIPESERTSIKVLNMGVSLITPLDADHYYVLPNGRKFPVTSVTTPMLVDGKVVGVVKVFRDATVEKEAKIIIEETIKSRTKELKEEQGKSLSILENTDEGVILTNSRGLVSYVNPSFSNMTGYSEAELSGRDFSEVIKAYDVKGKLISPAQLSDAAAVTAKKKETKVWIAKKREGNFGVIINAAPVYVDKEFIGVVRIIHDITEDMRLQQQKDDFFSIASHELRTPLTVISGNLDTILAGYGKSNLTSADTSLLKDSMTAADRLMKMVTDFLNVSRLDQGRLKYDLMPVDACKLGKEVINELKALAKEKGLDLSYVCDSRDVIVSADPGLLKEVFINLIGNSIKFTEKGGIKVWHELVPHGIKFYVEDTGMGIPISKHTLLFRRFQQAMDRTIEREAGGTGLGLYISREFMRVMGGKLDLEKSSIGKGSTFAFTLPLLEDKG